MPNDLLLDLKSEFYEWCGLVSIDEICSNPFLIHAIEGVERELLAVQNSAPVRRALS